MKRTYLFATLLASLMFSLTASAQDLVVNTFDTAGEATVWGRWWGAAPQTYEFDATADADENPSSGALKVTVDFDLAAYGGDNQFSMLRDLQTVVSGLDYASFEFDLFISQDSPQRSSGDLGFLEYGIRHSDFSQDYFGSLTVPVGGGWMHLSVPIPITNPMIDDIAGITIKMWSGNAGGQTGRMTLWIDNVKFIGNTGGPIDPPTLSIENATPGLALFASAAGQAFQRQGIRTVGSGYSFAPAAFDPVTYSLNIKKFPGAANPGFQAHIFLVPELGLPNGPDDPSVDWNAPHIIFFQVGNNADGTGFARFMYKTNQPSGNTMIWNEDPGSGPVGTLAVLGSTQPTGEWSMIFDDLNNMITVREPTGNVTNVTMFSVEQKTLFSGALYAYVGIQPNSMDNIGQDAVLASVKMQSEHPSFPSFEDNFSGSALDSATWAVVAASPAGVFVVPAEARYWVGWTLPDIGFNMQARANLDFAEWIDFMPAMSPQVAGRKLGLVLNSNLPGAESAFFRMINPTGTVDD